MKVDDLLKIDNKETNRTKAALIRAQLKKKARDNNPGVADDISGWRADPHQGPGNTQF